jgi:hypothetical protein
MGGGTWLDPFREAAYEDVGTSDSKRTKFQGIVYPGASGPIDTIQWGLSGRRDDMRYIATYNRLLKEMVDEFGRTPDIEAIDAAA